MGIDQAKKKLNGFQVLRRLPGMEAKAAMEVVQNDVEDDYVNCLKRLRDIYEWGR